jgi:hypothetical protein
MWNIARTELLTPEFPPVDFRKLLAIPGAERARYGQH